MHLQVVNHKKKIIKTMTSAILRYINSLGPLVWKIFDYSFLDLSVKGKNVELMTHI